MIDQKIEPFKKDIIELLAGCIFGDEQKVRIELRKYETERCRLLTGEVVDKELVGLIGVEYHSIEAITLLHIAVKPQHHRNGIGMRMIYGHLKENPIRYVEAETDIEAVHFYKQIGFQIFNLGEKYPGVERFKCTLNSSDNTVIVNTESKDLPHKPYERT